jgi:hypothetical protein
MLRGGKYHYVEPGEPGEAIAPADWVPAQEAVAETEPLLVE